MKTLITTLWELFKAGIAFIVGLAVYTVVGVAFGAFTAVIFSPILWGVMIVVKYMLLSTLGGF